jgi:hypothetical protein
VLHHKSMQQPLAPAEKNKSNRQKYNILNKMRPRCDRFKITSILFLINCIFGTNSSKKFIKLEDQTWSTWTFHDKSYKGLSMALNIKYYNRHWYWLQIWCKNFEDKSLFVMASNSINFNSVL